MTTSPAPGPGPLARAVLDVVDAIPRGRVMSYGDIARHLGVSSPRQIGQVMARHGHEVPWQRVVMADGRAAPHKGPRQLALLRVEGVALRGDRVDMAAARWEPPGPPGREVRDRRPGG